MSLTNDKMRPYALGDGHFNDLPVAAASIIYEGSAAGDNGAGYVRALLSGDAFRGFCDRQADNSTGAAGDIAAHLIREGYVQLDVANAAITDVGRPVFASDDTTFNLDGIGTFIGKIVRYVSSGVAVVEFDAPDPEDEVLLQLPVVMANLAVGDVLTAFTPGYHGRIKSLEFAVTSPVTTAAKAADLNAEIGAAALTGGVVSLTSANCTPLGAIVAGTAITAGAAFKDTDTVTILAANVTAFVEGQGVLLVRIGKP